VWGFKSVECVVHFCELMKSGILCRRKFELLWCGVMECCLYIIGLLTRLMSLNGFQWWH